MSQLQKPFLEMGREAKTPVRLQPESQLPEARQTVADTLKFIKQWIEHGDIKKAAEKFKIEKSHASKILKGKARPRVDFLKELKDKAVRNYNKLRIGLP
jgi:hypothetical protein